VSLYTFAGGLLMKKNALYTNKGYMYLLCAQAVSNIGDWLHILALFALIGIKWHASPFAMTGVMLCMTIPSILFGTPLGAIADKIDRKKIMIYADICRFFIVIGIAVSNHLWEIYCLLCLLAIFSDIFNPAKSGKLREMVDDVHIQQAVAYSEIINNSAKIIGPVISGFFVAAIGIQKVFYLDALTFIISACLLIGVPKTMRTLTNNNKQNQFEESKTSFFRELWNGITFIKTSATMLSGLIIISFVFLALQISDSQAIILLRLIPGSPISLVGFCMAASGIGMLVAAIILSKKTIGKSLVTLTVSPLVLGLSLVAAGLFIHYPNAVIIFVYPLIFFIAGFSFSMAVIPFNVLSQKKTPVQYTGRVFGTINSVTTLAVIIGLVIGGTLSVFCGVVLTFILSGGLLIIIGFCTVLIRKKIERRDQIGAESIGGTHLSKKIGNS
jgi:MFS family permease